ncbi:Eisosome assembly protein [Vermiconidia calcicola]|uniref:Eisosome assembly protein n=1 Tax=Vermiconidia calcicola TaxID=1690605 RepID=A0ACC3NKZ5_9PEZI|nr:Eisosome assembly protein [Vermiconidia calcicola]
MAGETTTSHSEQPPCPDPSVHEKQHQLSAAASTAALYATHPERNTSHRKSPLDSNGKLSSQSAAASLKYAQPQDLPSFPSRGADFSAANTAATLAKDHKMKELWHPELSAAGSKAALLAVRDGGKLDLWEPTPSSAGNSAATLAMRNKTLSPELDRGYTDVGRNNSMLAATQSIRRGRQRAGSTPVAPPVAYPDSQNSGKNALNAASVASVRAPPTDGWNSEANQAARVKNMHMDRNMFGEHPMVQPEVEEQKHKAAIHASAVSMAKQMYEYQKRQEVASETSSAINVGSAGAETAHRRNQSSPQTDIKQEAIKYIHLQDAAYKMAQERLAKMDKDMEQNRYREYYGYGNQPPKKSQSSVRGTRRGRKRASSEPQLYYEDSDDEEQARRIRTQMSQLSTGINTVDNKQRSDDRARLLAAAEKRVHERMHDMDEKVFQETGKPSQAMMDEWETKARAKAEKNREERQSHPGKTHIGGGKYMDQSEIEAIAAARLKPTFDELDATAEKKRARDEEFKAEKDRLELARMEEKLKDDQTKAEFKKIKEQDKAKARREKDERKAAERAEKEEAKARKSEDKRKSRDYKRETVPAVASGTTPAEGADKEGIEDEPHTREVPTQENQAREEPQEKSGRSMFDRIASKLKRHGNESKTANEPERAVEERKEDAKESELPAVTVHETADRPDDDAARPVGAAPGTGAVAAGSTEDDGAVIEDREMKSEEESKLSRSTEAAAGVAALGPIVAAGGLAVEHSPPRKYEEARSEISSLSTAENEESVDGRLQPETTTSAENTGQHNFAGPSLAVGGRPDLERHISQIPASSGSSEADDESSDLEDTDEDDVYGRPVASTYSTHSEVPITPAPTRADEAPTRDMAVVNDTPVFLNDSQFREPPTVVTDEPARPESPVSSLHSEEQRKSAIVNEEVPPDAPLVAPTSNASEPREAVPAPASAAQTAPAEKEVKQASPPEKEKEHKGLRGLFSKFRGKSKAETKPGKLHKSPPRNDSSEKSFQGGASYTGVGAKDDSKDDTITPVTTTSAGKEAEGLSSEPIGTVDTMGDNKAVGGTGGDARAASPSSFRRNNDGLKDLDDVSSSGADEDDLARGRGGRLTGELGDGPPKGGGTLGLWAPASNGEDDQFEEARDHFDESLAPPPAFGGQQKSASPTRETRFQEQL